jgi:hypothetical protein
VIPPYIYKCTQWADLIIFAMSKLLPRHIAAFKIIKFEV